MRVLPLFAAELNGELGRTRYSEEVDFENGEVFTTGGKSVTTSNCAQG
jgi:hypothetical protein